MPPYKKTHKNPLGPANLRLNLDRGLIALHGTNEPNQIGKFVSHGCVRHRNEDILKIVPLVKIGTPVYIVTTSASATLRADDFNPGEGDLRLVQHLPSQATATPVNPARI